MKLKLTHGDLHTIHQAALAQLKAESNAAIDSHLWPVACIIESFVDFANKSGMCLIVEQPKPRDWLSGAPE